MCTIVTFQDQDVIETIIAENLSNLSRYGCSPVMILYCCKPIESEPFLVFTCVLMYCFTAISLNVSRCKPNRCENGSRCLQMGPNERDNACVCRPGYFGRYCELTGNSSPFKVQRTNRLKHLPQKVTQSFWIMLI